MLRIKLVKSPIGNNKRNRATVAALGLRKMHQVVEHNDTPTIRGMIHHVKHMLLVEEVEGQREQGPSTPAKKGPLAARKARSQKTQATRKAKADATVKLAQPKTARSKSEPAAKAAPKKAEAPAKKTAPKAETKKAAPKAKAESGDASAKPKKASDKPKSSAKKKEEN